MCPRFTVAATPPKETSNFRAENKKRLGFLAGKLLVKYGFTPYIKVMKAVLTSKGQITIPAPIRKSLNLKQGDILEFDEREGFLKAVRVIDRKKMHSILGRGAQRLKGKSTLQILDDLRGRVEL